MTSLIQNWRGLRKLIADSEGKEAKSSAVGRFLSTPPCVHLFPQEIPRKESTLSSPFPFPEKHHLSYPIPFIHSLPCHLLSPMDIHTSIVFIRRLPLPLPSCSSH